MHPPTADVAREGRRPERDHVTQLDALREASERHTADVIPTGRMRLVHITTVPLSLGFLKGQVRYAAARNVSVTAVSAPGEELESFGRECGVGFAAVPMARRITPGRDLLAVWRITRLLRQLRPHIVHAHTPKGGVLGMIAAFVARTPVRIYDMWGLPFTTATGPRRLVLRWTERVACALAHEVHCVSHSLREVALAERLSSPSKILVLLRGSGHGVDARGAFHPDRVATTRNQTRECLGIPGEAVVIGFVGRIVRDKGLAELAGAWSILREQFPSTRLLLLGRFEPEDPVPANIEAGLRRDPRVAIVEWSTDTAGFYAAMDVVALPTYREGFPNVPLEAAAMALPVVATRVPGCVDAVQDGVTGTLVPARDAKTLAAALADYVKDPVLRARHGHAGRERVLRDFQPEPLWDALHARYHDLVRKRVAGWSSAVR